MAMQLTPSDVRAAERELCKRSLAYFAQRAWHVLEPATPLKWGWALDAICAHLEAVSRGEINRLLMNVPPGSMKSLLTGVIWPAWEWGPLGRPDRRFIGTAHKQDLAVRDAMKCRRLIQSPWFQDRWPLALMADSNAKLRFENDKTGFREAMAFTSTTGARGDRVILDDPLSADDANSEAALIAAERTFTEALPTRVNNEHSAIVVIMQRLHERDVSGIILGRELPYTHLCIPMRYEANRKCVTPYFTDPREKDGDLMFPERFPESQVSELERTLGSYASAGQLQQRPAPRGGGMFKRSDFRVIPARPTGYRWVRGWDLAATDSSDAARTAGVLMGIGPDNRLCIAHAVKDQVNAAGVERLLASTAAADGREVRGSIPQDPGSAGKSWAAHLLRTALMGYSYEASPETGDKETRAMPLAAQVEAGNVDIVAGDWNTDFLDEASTFPAGRFKDQIDAATRAFDQLVAKRATAQVFL